MFVAAESCRGCMRVLPLPPVAAVIACLAPRPRLKASAAAACELQHRIMYDTYLSKRLLRPVLTSGVCTVGLVQSSHTNKTWRGERQFILLNVNTLKCIKSRRLPLRRWISVIPDRIRSTSNTCLMFQDRIF